jgi:hypothetical protein
VWPSQPSTDVARDRLHQAQQFANAKLSWTMAQRGGYADTCPFID